MKAMKTFVVCLFLLNQAFIIPAAPCQERTLDFIVLEGDATLAAMEDDIRADLAKLNITVVVRFLSKEDMNANMTAGNFNLCFSETWGPPYDPHSFAASWKSPDEAHYAALKGMQNPSQAELTSNITNVMLVENLQNRQQMWKDILMALHAQAIDLPVSGKRIPTVLSTRLAGYYPGQQQYDYPVQNLQVISGSKTITVAPGAQSGLFSSIGRLDPHTYRPNEFFANNWVYESLVSYGADGVIEPALATSWTVAPNANGGEDYRFTLRQGVKFHDGSDWNCTVAKLNFDHVLAKPLTTGDWHGWYDLPKQLTNWSCDGTFTFSLTTKDKYYPLLQELTYIRPLRMLSPAKFVSGITTDPLTNNSCHVGWGTISAFNQTVTCAGILGPAGTGPFRYIETNSTSGDVKFDRFTDHWSSSPHVETMIVKKYADADAVMAALLDGSLDAVMGAGVLKPSDLKTIQTQHASTFHVFLGPVIQNRVIIMNANKAPTNDLTLRKTIMHGVNKAAIIDKELYGFAEPVDTMFPKNAPYCDLDLTPRWDYDAQKAELLRHAPAPSGTTAPCPTTTTTTTTGTTTVTTTAAVTTDAESTSEVTGSLTIASTTLSKNQVEQGVKKSLAQHMNVSESSVTVTATQSRRLNSSPTDRRLTGTWSVVFSVQVPTSQSTAVAAKAGEIATDATTFNQVLKTSLISLGVSATDATVSVTNFTHTVQIVTTVQTTTDQETSNNAPKCRLASLVFAVVFLAMRC